MKERESQQISKAEQRKRAILVHARSKLGSGLRAEINIQLLRLIMMSG